MRRIIAVLTTFLLFAGILSPSYADVVSSEEALRLEQGNYNTQQLLSYFDRDEVQAQLLTLGVDSESAKARIGSMTDAEIASLNAQMLDMPAAGSTAGTVLTVLIVITVLDLLGLTDVFSFIDPIF